VGDQLVGHAFVHNDPLAQLLLQGPQPLSSFHQPRAQHRATAPALFVRLHGNGKARVHTLPWSGDATEATMQHAHDLLQSPGPIALLPMVTEQQVERNPCPCQRHHQGCLLAVLDEPSAPRPRQREPAFKHRSACRRGTWWLVASSRTTQARRRAARTNASHFVHIRPPIVHESGHWRLSIGRWFRSQ